MLSWGLLASIGGCRSGLIDARGLSLMHIELADGCTNGGSHGMALHCILAN